MNRKGKGKRKGRVKRKGKGKGKGKSKSPAMEKKAPWLELPEGIWANILHRLGAVEILETAQKVCTMWRRVCKDPSMWRFIDMWNYGDPYMEPYDLEEMCCHAVDRSQGELVYINLEYFATDELLVYIAERSPKLKVLSIACCYRQVCEGLVEVAQKLPLLEELSLTHTTITPRGIEALGHSCPNLMLLELNKSFNFDEDSDEEDERNEMAVAIAKNLPILDYLRLIGNSMTNEGLKAILDGCPHLISLDLRQCFNISLDKDLSSRISLQIKDVKHPQDSLDDLEFSFDPSDDAYDPYNMSDDTSDDDYYAV